MTEEEIEEMQPILKRDKELRETLNRKLVERWWSSGENAFARGVTAEDFTEVAMEVMEPLLNALDEIATAADRLTKSHAHFVQDSSDPGSEALGAEWEMVRLLRKIKYFEPHDWTYISRFSATPQEIHKVLKDGLCEDTYLNYQRFICEAALNVSLDEQHVRVEAESGEPGCWHDGANNVIKYLDPKREGYRFPADLINPA